MKTIKFQRRSPTHSGRPRSYRPEYAEMAYNYALLGATEAHLCKFFGVSTYTIHMWKREIPEFLESLTKGRAEADAKVARSLYMKAVGYDRETVKIVMGRDGVPISVPVIEHQPPDTLSMIFWLKNRQPELWRDKKDVSMSGADGGPINIKVTKIESRIIDAEFTDISADSETVQGLPSVVSDIVG